jgi:hypothetical protein
MKTELAQSQSCARHSSLSFLATVGCGKCTFGRCGGTAKCCVMAMHAGRLFFLLGRPVESLFPGKCAKGAGEYHLWGTLSADRTAIEVDAMEPSPQMACAAA